MKNIILVDPFSGASGDMFLGALVDVGAPFEAIKSALLEIPELAGVAMEQETVTRGVFSATRIRVECPEENVHRSLSTIRGIIENAPLKDAVKRGAIDTFTRLAEAEAKVHGFDIEEVHFHEVGALDAIVDIVGTHVALDLLGTPAGYARPLTLGTGSTQSAHGEIPVPAPATLELLSDHRVRFTERAEELVTPTGAAIIAAGFAPLAADARVTPKKIGYGAGSRETGGLPNVLRVILGQLDEAKGHVCIITSTIDDMNPEIYGYLMDNLFSEGALEVYYNPVFMKKNRPGLEITLITEERDVYAVADYLMANSTTLGVRINREERVELERRKDTVETKFGIVDIKVASRPDGRETMSPEYESCKLVAEKANVNLLSIYQAVQKAWEKRRPA